MKELFYIKGDPTNSKGVKDALLEKYPNAENPNNWAFTDNDGYYCVFDNKIDVASIDSGFGSFLKEYGTEIFPKKKQEFEEKIMYQAVIRDRKKDSYSSCYKSDRLFETIQEAFNYDENVCGYKEVKVKNSKEMNTVVLAFVLLIMLLIGVLIGTFIDTSLSDVIAVLLFVAFIIIGVTISYNEDYVKRVEHLGTYADTTTAINGGCRDTIIVHKVKEYKNR